MSSQIRYLSTLQFHAFFTSPLPRSTPAATHHPFTVSRRRLRLRLSPPPSTVPLLVFSSDFELNRTILTTGKERNEQLRRDRRFCNTKLFNWKAMAMTVEVLAGLAFMFSSSILLQILACAIYSNWWPLLSALMYVLVPMPCMFFGGGSTQFLLSRDGGGWIDAAKFLTGASAVGSFAIPAILRHANMIETGAMVIDFTAFFIFGCTVLCFHRASLDDDEW